MIYKISEQDVIKLIDIKIILLKEELRLLERKLRRMIKEKEWEEK